MISFVRNLPGQLIDFGQAHPFLAIIAGVVMIGAGYLVLLKLALALKDLDDVRKRSK